MNPVSLIAGVNRVTLNTAAPAAPTDGVADDANIAGMFIYSRVPIRIWQMNSSNIWSELDLLTGSGGSRIATVYFDATDVTRIFLQSTGDDNVTVRVVRREQEGSNVQQEGANQRVHVAATFRSLSDTPNAYTGQAGKYPRVNDGETGIEFVESSGEGAQGPTGPQGPAGADGADGGIGTAVLGNPHITTGSFIVDVPGSAATWAIIPTQYYKHDWDDTWDTATKQAYSNPTNSGKVPNVINNIPGGTVIPRFSVGGFDFLAPVSDSPGFHPTYSSVNRGWAPIHGDHTYDPRIKTSISYQYGLTSWQPNFTFSDERTAHRWYTYGPMGSGPDGAKIEVTGSIMLDPRSNIFIGSPGASGMEKYPEFWTTGDEDALLITRNQFINNSNDTYYQFGDRRSLVKFASSSNVDLGRGSTLTIGTGHKLITSDGGFHLPNDTKLPSTILVDKLTKFETYSTTQPIEMNKLKIVGHNLDYPEATNVGGLECVPDARFQSDVRFNGAFRISNSSADDDATWHVYDGTATARFGAHTDIKRLHLGKGINDFDGGTGLLAGQSFGSAQPAGTNSPLMIRQAGQYFGHSVMLECPYAGENTQGWGIRVDSSKELVFQAFQLDGNGDLVDGTWNNASFGRGYLADGTDVAQITFTGQHRSLPAEGTVADFQNKVGLIVVSTGKYASMTEEDITINDAMPKVEISSKANDKRAFGVVSNVEDVDSDERRFQLGLWGSSMDKPEGDDRVIINSVGEGAMWVTDINGALENGDYITTSDIPGYGMKQDDDLLHNYTVAKITMDCDFDLSSTEYRCEQIGSYKRAFVGVTYHCG